MGIRRALGRIGVRSRALAAFHGARRLAAHELPILAYHRVIEPADTFDPENVSADPDTFRRQMRYVRDNYDVLSFSELNALSNELHAVPARPLIITFDDGFADNYDNAFPILREFGLSALFSVVTTMVGSSEMYWFDRAACLLRKTPAGERVHIAGFELAIADGESRDIAVKRMLQWLKDLPDDVRRARLNEIDAGLDALGVDAADRRPHIPMNWDQLAEMRRAGMEIGSHTATHPILAQLPNRECIAREMSQSRASVESRLGGGCHTLAYPEGLAYAIDERVRDVAIESGYLFGLTSLRGMNRFPLCDVHRMRRIQIHHSNDDELFRAVLQLPELID